MRKLLLSTFLILSSIVGLSQDYSVLNGSSAIKGEPIISKGSEKRVIQLDEVPFEANKIPTPIDIIITPPDDTNTSSEYAGRTATNFSVSQGGGANYTIPFTLPQGVRDIGPTLGLSYNSQAPDGLVGWGWNVYGLSTITRVGTTNFHDDFIDGVDFDNNDRFSLDGQRLMLKTGTYGAANSTYQTETYSNIKITAQGTSNGAPAYFKVQHPDGSLAYYGLAGNSRGKLEWALHKKVDPQGNFIQYDYVISNNLLRIDKIKYGSRGNTASPNEIRFVYKNKSRPQLSYYNNQAFKRTKILDRVEVYSGSQIFRKYKLQHSTTSLGYQRVFSVQEFNASNKSFPKILFNYSNSSSTITRINENYSSIFPGVDSRYDAIKLGDLTADGHQNMVVYRRNSKNKLHVFNSVFGESNSQQLGQTFNLSFDELFFSSIINHQGKNLQNQALTLVSESVGTSNSTVRFKNFLYGTSLNLQYEKTYTFPKGPVGIDYCDNYENPVGSGKIKKQYINGDFNGDGLTDVLAIPQKYQVTNCYTAPNDYELYDDCDCETTTPTQGNSPVYFLDLNRNVANTTPLNIGSLISRIEPTKDQLFGVDFNGDGRTDLIHLREGAVRVYSLSNNGNSLELIAYEADSAITFDRPTISGDFNGDGKFDFAVATAENSENWKFFLSEGTDFNEYVKDINIPYKKSERKLGTYTVNGISMQNPIYEYKYIAQDFNGDGNTDILYHEIVQPNSSTTIVSEKMKLYANKLSNSSSSTPYFQLAGSISETNNGMAKFGLPIVLENKFGNGNLEYGYIIQNRVFGYKFNKDHKVDTELYRITNDGLRTDIEYKNLTADNVNGDSPAFYTFNTSNQYPFFDLQVAPTIKLVERAIRSGGGKTQQQVFYYQNAVTHNTGLGYLGFEYVKRSNWYGDGVPILISGSKHDMSKRGAVTEEWTSTSLSNSPSQFASKKKYFYNTSLSSNKVYTNLPRSISTTNGLENHTTGDYFTYNSFNNITQLLTLYKPIGTVKTTYTYSNNTSHSAYSYHVGRILTKKVENNLYGSTHSNEEQFTYQNNLVKIIKRRGVGTPWLFENISHDLFGNITRKVVSGDGESPREERFYYDTSGRFMTKYRDVNGLETTSNYNFTKGTVTSSTDPYGNSQSFTYDGWSRPLVKTDYLGNETKRFYNKENLSGGVTSYTTYIDFPNLPDSKIWTNIYGSVIKSKSQSLNDRWIFTETEYDSANRLKRESEPYFENESPNLWSSIIYDQYGRPISQISETGEVVNTIFNGLSITVNDGTTTVTSDRDMLGNVVRLTDEGGVVNYKYYPNGELKESKLEDNTVTVNIDGWGRKSSLNDPAAGNYTYEYNIFGEITKETSPNGETLYSYDNYGLLTNKKITGSLTDLDLDYTYNGTHKKIVSVNGVDNLNNKNFLYNYTYDNYLRLTETNELTNGAQYSSTRVYNNLGQPSQEIYSTSDLGSGLTSNVNVSHIYDDSGILKELRDGGSNSLLWELNEENARGFGTSVVLGNGIEKTTEYDQYGYTTRRLDVNNSTQGSLPAIDMEYQWNASRGLLMSRNNNIFNWEETFIHDNQDRLTQVLGPSPRSHNYDARGRISDNSTIGAYEYSQVNNPYQLTKVDLNNQGDLLYQQRAEQKVTYNAFKQPIRISDAEHGKIDFEYSPLMTRSASYYGGDSDNVLSRKYFKQYAGIVPVEIVKDQESGAVKIITYINGNEYSAPIVYVTEQESAETSSDFYYLHRDYLGSILGISDALGDVVEQAQFGAWGTIDKFNDAQGGTVFDDASLLGRGFTGHEHLFEVDLIHMNGRLYDANLGRFLSPDNYIQDPYNSQSFNRYGYVWNNPLTLSDPSGEFVILTAIIVGAVVGAYFGGVQANGGKWNPTKWNWSSGDTWIGVIGGAGIGAVRGGLGAVAAAAVAPVLSAAGITGGILGYGIPAAVGGAVSGAFSGSFMTLLPGGNVEDFFNNGWKGAAFGAAAGFVIGGTIGAIKTPPGHNIWTGKPIPKPTVSTVSSLKPQNATPLSTQADDITSKSSTSTFTDSKGNTGIVNDVGEEIIDEGAKFNEVGRKATNNVLDKEFGNIRNDQANHIFRKSLGHINPETVTSKVRSLKLFESVLNDPSAIVIDRINPGGVHVREFTKFFDNGTVWVHTIGGKINNAGVNYYGN